MDVHKSNILFTDKSKIRIGRGTSQMIKRQGKFHQKGWPRYKRAGYKFKTSVVKPEDVTATHRTSTLEVPYIKEFKG